MKQSEFFSENVKKAQLEWENSNFTLFYENNLASVEDYAREFMRQKGQVTWVGTSRIVALREGLTETDVVCFNIMKRFMGVPKNSPESLYVQLNDMTSGAKIKKNCLKALSKYPYKREGKTPEEMFENSILWTLQILDNDGLNAITGRISFEKEMNKMSETRKLP